MGPAYNGFRYLVPGGSLASSSFLPGVLECLIGVVRFINRTPAELEAHACGKVILITWGCDLIEPDKQEDLRFVFLYIRNLSVISKSWSANLLVSRSA